MQASRVKPVANLGLGLGYECSKLRYQYPANLHKDKRTPLNSLSMHTKQPWTWLSAINTGQQMQACYSSLSCIIADEYFQGLPRFREILSDIYSPLYRRRLDPETEMSVHSGGTEAILSTITAFVESGDEVIVLEPAFDL